MEKLITGSNQMLNNKAVYLFLFLLIAALTLTARGTDLTGFAFILLGGYICSSLLIGVEDRRLVNILLVAFIIRLGFLFFSTYVTPLPVEGSDSVTFESHAWRSAQAWLAGEEGALEGGGRYYIAIVAFFYTLFGRVELIPRFVTLLTGMLVIYLTYKTALFATGKEQVARLSALAAALFPALVVYSPVLLREQFVIIFFILSVYFYLHWMKVNSLLSMFTSIAFLFLTSMYHGGMIAIGLAYFLIFLIYNPKQGIWFNLKDNLGLKLSSVGFLGVVFLVFWNFFRSKIPSSLFESSATELYYDLAGVTRFGRTAFLTEFVPESYFDLIWQTPLRMFYFSLSPFPWQIETFMDFVVFIDAFIFGATLLLFIYGWRFVKLEQRSLYLSSALIVLVFLAAFAWGTHNFGTAIRHRQKVVWLIFIYASFSVTSFSWWDDLLKRIEKIKVLRFVRQFI